MGTLPTKWHPYIATIVLDWYERAHIVDRNPSPLPPETLKPDPIYESIHVSDALTVTKKPATYPAPPSGSALDPDDCDAKDMLARLDLYRLGREPLASMANFCLTVVTPARRHYQISKKVISEVGRLTAKKGGAEARKAEGRGDPFTSEEIAFLEAAVTAFIRRAAEKAADPNGQLRVIGMADLPRLSNQTEPAAK